MAKSCLEAKRPLRVAGMVEGSSALGVESSLSSLSSFCSLRLAIGLHSTPVRFPPSPRFHSLVL